MKKCNLFLMSIVAMFAVVASVNAAAGDKRPDYAVNEGGKYFTCTVGDAETLEDALTMTWGPNGGKSCDDIILASGSTITVTKELDFGDKILWVGYDDDDTIETLKVAAGGKLTFGQDAGINLSDDGVLSVVDGGVIDSQTSITGLGDNGVVKVSGTGSTLKIYNNNGSESFGIDEVGTLEVTNGGTIEVTGANGGINAANIIVTDGTLNIHDNKNAGLKGKLTTTGDSIITVANNKKGLQLADGSSIGGNTFVEATGNTNGDIVLQGKKGNEVVTVTDNAKVNVTKVVKNNEGVTEKLVVDGTGAEFTYTSEDNQDYVVLKNGYITDNNETTPVNHVLYANHDIYIDENVTVKNTATTDIKVTTRDSKNSQTLTAGEEADYKVVKVTIGEADLILFVNDKLSDLNEVGAQKLEEFKTPEKGYSFEKLVDEDGNEVDENTAFTADVVLTAKFVKIPETEESAPNTLDASLTYVGLAVLCLGAIVVTFRKLRNN